MSQVNIIKYISVQKCQNSTFHEVWAIFESDHGVLNINVKTLLSMDPAVYIDLENCVSIREVNYTYVLVHKVRVVLSIER